MNEEINIVDIKYAFKISIELWEHIADIPDTTEFNTDDEMKEYYLRELDFPQMHNSCAFCSLMKKNNSNCDYCLLGKMCENEYQTWKYEIEYGCGHVQDMAKDILNAITQLYHDYLDTIGD